MLGSSLSYLLWTTLVQFSPFTDWVVVWSGVGDVCVGGGEGTRGMLQQKSSSSLSCGKPVCAVMTRAGRQGCPLFDLMHPAFPLPTTASPTLQGALKDGFGEAVMAHDMSEPC